MKKTMILALFCSVLTLAGCETTTVDEEEDEPNEINIIDQVDLEYSYTIVDTNQTTFFDNSDDILEMLEGEDFFGQDASYTGNEPSYHDNGDGTVTDLNTGLMWAQSMDLNGDGTVDADDKLSYQEAMDTVEDVTIGGYDDWRIPTIKELYSLIDFSGKDVSGYDGSTNGLVPFIDDSVFDFGYGDTDAGERIIDAQMVSSTVYANEDNYDTLIFGVNFADGRIKGYGERGFNGGDKTFYVMYVRGNTEYGENDFEDNEDGTITDNATGLMWMSTGSEETFTWEEALEYAEIYEYGGYDDWRLPNAKELQSIVDYTKSPDTSNSPAIDDLFTLTSFLNEEGELDWGYYWTSTTHENMTNGGNAIYISFGRALGYMNNDWLDVHGAGAQRSDPKVGDASEYPYGHGPQGDAIRIDNYLILVRDSDSN